MHIVVQASFTDETNTLTQKTLEYLKTKWNPKVYMRFYDSEYSIAKFEHSPYNVGARILLMNSTENQATANLKNTKHRYSR